MKWAILVQINITLNLDPLPIIKYKIKHIDKISNKDKITNCNVENSLFFISIYMRYNIYARQ